MKTHHRQKGQITLEMVLILSTFLFLSYMVKQQLFDKPDNPFYQFVTAPWKSIAVMMESGIWDNQRAQGRNNHPNHFQRMQSEKGMDPT